jgi:hypothetical protein
VHQFQTHDGKNIDTVEQLVLTLLEGKKDGYFVEIGAFHSKDHSTTYNLEKSYGWKGLAVEMIPSRAEEYNQNRNAYCMTDDGSKADYRKYFVDSDWPEQLDFLSIDVDFSPEFIALQTLINIPLSTYRFNVIMFEHSSMMSTRNKLIREISEHILESYGYTRIIDDPMDDIWVDAKALKPQIYNPLRQQNTYKTDNNAMSEPYDDRVEM